MHRSTDIEKISLIFPCFNEGENLSHLEEELLPVLTPLQNPWEIILVDDGSTDNTADQIRSLSKKIPGLKSVFHPFNRGLGSALRSGFEVASGDFLVTLDADLTFHPRQIPLLVEAMTGDVDAVLGSPQRGRMEEVSWIRRLLSHGVNLIYRWLLGRPFTSVSSIFRIYRRSSLQKLSLKSTSFDINAEILVGLIQSGCRISEIPAVLTVRKFGESKINMPREIMNHVKMFIRILILRTKRGERNKS